MDKGVKKAILRQEKYNVKLLHSIQELIDLIVDYKEEKKNKLMYVCNTILEIKKTNMKYNNIKIKDFPDINIAYKDMKEREEYM